MMTTSPEVVGPSAARSTVSSVRTSAETPVTLPLTLLLAEPVTVIQSPTANPSVTNDPATRVIVSPVAPTSANVTLIAPVRTRSLLDSSTRRSRVWNFA